MNYPDADDLLDGKFTDGNQVTGIEATIASAEHMNAVYDELINVIKFAGIEPATETRSQLQQALNYYRDASNLNTGTVPFERLPITLATAAEITEGESNTAYVTPSGLAESGILADYTASIHWFATQITPSGFIKANGDTLSRITYAKLFEKIGITFGEGDGSTTFNVPDLRGEFIRGWDDGRGVDVDREFGSWQEDAIRNIVGDVTGTKEGLFKDQGADFSGAFTNDKNEISKSNGGSNKNTLLSNVGFDASRVVPTAADNRPRNIALIAYIKY